MTHTFKLTPELTRRIHSGIADAQRNIDREMKYSEEFRNHKMIEQDQAHIAKMMAALESGYLTAE